MGLREGRADLTKLTLPEDNPLVGQRMDELELPPNTALVSVIRAGDVILPTPDLVFEAGDETLFVADSSVEGSIQSAIHRAELRRASSRKT